MFCSGACFDSTEPTIDEAAEAFWSGVRACMLVAARERYRRRAHVVRYMLRWTTFREDEALIFWGAVRELQIFWGAVCELQLLGEVGHEAM